MVGEEAIAPYFVEENRNETAVFSIWKREGRFVPPEETDVRRR
jgi:hypothetical protein